MSRTHHPAQPQAGLAGRAQGDVGGGHVRRGLQGLDLPGGLAGGAGAHDVQLTHAEPGGRMRDTGLCQNALRWDGRALVESAGLECWFRALVQSSLSVTETIEGIIVWFTVRQADGSIHN